MGFFNNMKNLKDQTLGNERFENFNQLQGLFNIIDSQAEKEDEKNKKEKEYFESLTPDEKIEYKRKQRRNKNLKRLGLYGLTAAGMATGVGIPVLMAANVGMILSDDSLTFNKEKHDEKLKNINKKGSNKAQPKKVPKPRTYFSVEYNHKGIPHVNTLVDFDPYLLDFRYQELVRE